MLPKQKPWKNQEVHNVLRVRSQSFKSGDADSYKTSMYNLDKAVKKAKRDFRSKLEDETDILQLWEGF